MSNSFRSWSDLRSPTEPTPIARLADRLKRSNDESVKLLLQEARDYLETLSTSDAIGESSIVGVED